MTADEVLDLADKILNMVFIRFAIAAGTMLVVAAAIALIALVVVERSNKK